MQLENNGYFWQKLDTLLLSSDVVISQPKGSCHPKYDNLIYPVDYGYLVAEDISTDDHIAVYRGNEKVLQVDAIIVCVDILKKDMEVKLLVGCDKQQIYEILAFVNQTDFQKAIIVYRSSEIPQWTSSH